MDFAELEIFRSVAAEGSVTRAAQRLQRAQSNVTTRLRQLEEALGTALFRREGKRMTLTAEGETFLAYAHRLLALEQEARAALHPDRPGGRLRLGSMESTAAARLPLPLARFHAAWPEVALELTMAPSQRLLDALLAHALDCALVACLPGELPDSLAARPVFTEELLLLLPADHPPPRGPGDTSLDTLAALEPGCTYRRIAESWLGGAAPRRLELGSYHAIFACVAAGSCVGVAPRSVLEVQRENPAIKGYSLQSIETLLVWRKGYRSAALAALEQQLQPGPKGAVAPGQCPGLDTPAVGPAAPRTPASD